ncbi:MAG: DNA methyltransferase [Bacteroidia bacterium]|nr:DNA methyltransferase [Bacteroidia bacterium]
MLYELGYTNIDIVRSKMLQHPFLKIGSQKRQVNIVPDYLLKVGDNYAWVLDAKAPDEDIKTGYNVEQVFSYAIHPEIRTRYFALCNGREFALYRQDTERPVLFFNMQDVGSYWGNLETYLSPGSFQEGKKPVFELVEKYRKKYDNFDYINRPLLDEIPVRKRAAKRHFGVHGYFTKQAWNVVREYILNFSKPGDIVFDPFGGSGVTLVEALMTDRQGIHIDLNPMSIFIVDSLIAPVNIPELNNAFDRIKNRFQKLKPETKEEIDKALSKYPYPQGYTLPKGSDVETIEQLFTNEQLANLSLIKYLIKNEKNENLRKTLLLAFSTTITKINRTYHNSDYASENAGDCAAFRYYRYRIATEPVNLNIWDTFEGKFWKIVNAKKDIAPKINEDTISNAQVYKGTATNLKEIKTESIDYIYTDPPYGSKIPYLDLSVMWNAWLGLEVTEQDRELEAIEGGEMHKTKDDYSDLISKSIMECYRVLKFDRWMSFVFAHKDPEFWHLIIETAERAGFEYAGAVKQANGQTSFKKRQNPFTVLAGQLIINFKKVRKPKAILRANLGMNIGDIVLETIEGVIAKHNGATLEQINDELIIKGLELGFLDLLKKEYSDLTSILMSEFDYNTETEQFMIRKNMKFKTSIDLNLRVKYYLMSYLRRQEIENKTPTFDEIVLNILPLLRNGTTPEHQTILNVLEAIGEHIGKDRWKLKSEEAQLKLF